MIHVLLYRNADSLGATPNQVRVDANYIQNSGRFKYTWLNRKQTAHLSIFVHLPYSGRCCCKDCVLGCTSCKQMLLRSIWKGRNPNYHETSEFCFRNVVTSWETFSNFSDSSHISCFLLEKKLNIISLIVYSSIQHFIQPANKNGAMNCMLN